MILGTASLLHENKNLNADETDRCLAALYRQSQRLTTMVDNLLDLARLKEGRLSVQLRSVELGSFITKVLDDNPPPESTSVKLAIEESCRVLADADAIDQIFSNLLVNAYRYGGDRIRVRSRASADGIWISVSDNGPGVPAELLPKLFEPFARGKLSSKMGGSGLGLALVKSLVEANGGEIRHEPSPEGGASFELRLTAAP